VTEQARLVDVGIGLAPQGAGWFVLNVRDTVWITNEAFGARPLFEVGPRIAEEAGLEEQMFAQLGVNLAVLDPGQPNCMYHAESNQEDFLVLAGECLLIVEGQERPLKQWDFFHCPAGTEHVIVGAGDGPCAVLMIGAREDLDNEVLAYPRNETALKHGAGVETATPSPDEAYGPFPDWAPGRPDAVDRLFGA
jgi:uncharacterized cupin superfamily protein